MTPMNFKSLDHLNQAITDNLPAIRKLGPFDYIVGIPRSGMLVANALSIFMGGIPVADIYQFMSGQCVSHKKERRVLLTPNTRILLVDDTVSMGGAMRDALNKLHSLSTNFKITKMAVWIAPDSPDVVDYYCGIERKPRIFEWNMWKNERLKNVAFDLDGVFCRDPDQHENDKGPNLQRYYQNADVKFIPEVPVKYIITNRLERHRRDTEGWLSKYNITYDKLIMKENEKEGHIEHKTRKIKSVLNDISLYVESSERQASRIAEKVNIPIWCIDNRQLYNTAENIL